MDETVHVVSVEGQAVGVIGDSEIALVLDGEEVTMPILEVTWADERQWCSLVHDYLDSGVAANGNCPMRQGSLCRLTADKPCLFDEPESSEGWEKARQWVRSEHGLIWREEAALT
ncbi:MAG: hypothetical protein ABIN58_08425 [candidate division WOR-3 bacterium]